MQDKPDLDLEDGPPSPEGHPSPAFEIAVQELQTELREFISDHVSKFLSLQASLSPSNPDHVHSTIGMAATISDKSPDKPLPRAQIPTSRTLGDHTKHLHDFLRSHMQCIRVLQAALSSQQLGRPNLDLSRTNDDSHVDYFQSLSEQFDTQVVVSTFTASLIVSWLSFVQTIVPTSHETAFNIGMFISFLALGFHFGNIVVAGRGAAIASQRAANPKDADDNAKYDRKYFRHYLELSEQLHFAATIMFMVAVLTMTFYTFSSIVYPTALVGVYALLAVIVFWSAYWKVSMTLRNLKLMVNGVRILRTRAKKRSNNLSS